MLYEIDICDPDTREPLHTVMRGTEPLHVMADSSKEAVARYARGLGYTADNPYPWHLKAREVRTH